MTEPTEEEKAAAVLAADREVTLNESRKLGDRVTLATGRYLDLCEDETTLIQTKAAVASMHKALDAAGAISRQHAADRNGVQAGDLHFIFNLHGRVTDTARRLQAYTEAFEEWRLANAPTPGDPFTLGEPLVTMAIVRDLTRRPGLGRVFVLNNGRAGRGTELGRVTYDDKFEGARTAAITTVRGLIHENGFAPATVYWEPRQNNNGAAAGPVSAT